MILAEKIALLRRQNGWSQEELADQLNVSRQAVSKWMNRRVGWFAGAYWCLVTAVYLAVSFWNDNWEKSWIIWAVAGLVFAALYSAVRAWADRKNQ